MIETKQLFGTIDVHSRKKKKAPWKSVVTKFFKISPFVLSRRKKLILEGE